MDRKQVSAVVEALDRANVRYVYNSEPMFQWILMFEGRGRIVARGMDPEDRVSSYAAQVDSARLAGAPVALVARTGPRAYEVLLRPDPKVIEANFPLAPRRI